LSGGYAPAVDFARCVIVSFVLELVIRGTGYFSGTTILLVAGLTTLSIGAAVRPVSAMVYTHAPGGAL
jgi:hypothetical protein